MSRTPTLFRSLGSLAIVPLITVAVLLATPVEARAAIDELSVTVSAVTPNPIPVGSAATVSADFSLSGDAGPITVGLRLNADPGFGSLSIDSVSAELTNCQTTTTTITCDWDGDAVDSPQTISAIVSVEPDVSPYSGGQIEAMGESGTEENQTYGWSEWIEAAPPIGTTSFSGSVITSGGTPVGSACIFVLSDPQYAFPAVADADGNWSITGLPDGWSYVVAAIPAFVGTYGPCAGDGPPAPPAAGELQPVFYDDVWIDLADPVIADGLGNPFDFAVAAGAMAFTDSATGLVSCLTTASGSTTPRPSCVPAPTTTTSSTTTTLGTTSTSTDAGVGAVTSNSSAETLPVTGTSTTVVGVVGFVLLLLGLGLLHATRAHAPQNPTG